MSLNSLFKEASEILPDEKYVVLLIEYENQNEFPELGYGIAISISRESALLLKAIVNEMKELTGIGALSFQDLRYTEICPCSFIETDNTLLPAGHGKSSFKYFKEMTESNANIEKCYSQIKIYPLFHEVFFEVTGHNTGHTSYVGLSPEKLLDAVEKALAIPPRQIEVRSSIDNLICNEFGYVLNIKDTAWANEDANKIPVKFNFKEYQEHYNEDVPDSVDIQDLGCWRKHTKYIEYIPPDKTWRLELQEGKSPEI